MATVVVTLFDSQGETRDLELPADISVSRLAPAVARAIGVRGDSEPSPPVRYMLKLIDEPDVIPVDMTLESAGVVHGDRLRMLVKEIPKTVAATDAGVRFTGPGFVAAGGETFALRGPVAVIGRIDRSSGITQATLAVDLTQLDSPEAPSVSRRHAQILMRKGEWLLEDLGSTNGTRVNDRRLGKDERVALRHGDEVHFGEVKLAFVWDSQE